MIELSVAEVRRSAERNLPSLIEMRDSLDLREEDLGKFDLVLGNPPYGRSSLSPERRKNFVRSVYGHANLYGLFTDAAIRWTKSRGVIAYVTPTSMLSGLYFKSLRALLAAEAPPITVNFIDKREGVFADVLQETMLATYRRGGLARGPRVGFIGEGRIAKTRRTEAFAMPARPDAPWLLPRAPERSSLTRRLGWMPHRLKDYGYEVSTGPLVWNRHKKQFRATRVNGAVPVIWAESITSAGEFIWRSAKRNHLPWFLPRDAQDDWLVVDLPCVLLQRTTAKEQPRRLIAAELPKSFIRRHRGITVENHVNMIRPIVPRPLLPPAVLAVLFNSAAVDAAFRCINGSVAVSAFELEELPLPSPDVMRKVSALLAARVPLAKIERAIAIAYRTTDVASSR
jgi:adenine-specific DNA-methyltransferase